MTEREINRNCKVVVTPSAADSVVITDAEGRLLFNPKISLIYNPGKNRMNITYLGDGRANVTYVPKEMVPVYYPEIETDGDLLVVSKGTKEKIYEIKGYEIKNRADVVVSASGQREAFKVYETPVQVMEVFVRDVIDIYRHYVINKVGSKLKHFDVVGGLKEEDRFAVVSAAKQSENFGDFLVNLPPSVRQAVSVFFASDRDYQEFKKEVHLVEKALKIYTDLKTADHRDVFPYIENNWQDIVEVSRLKLEEPPKVVVYDPQAGSGEAILSLFDRYRVPGIITGTEIRDVKNPDPRYKVLTNTDSIMFSDVILSKVQVGVTDSIRAGLEDISGFDRAKAIRGLFTGIRWVNPPYDTRKTFIDSTLNNHWQIKTQDKLYRGITFGLLSHAHLPDVRNKLYHGNIYVVPSNSTGYTGDNMPQKFVYLRGLVFSPYPDSRLLKTAEKEDVNFEHSVYYQLTKPYDLYGKYEHIITPEEIDRIVEESQFTYKYIDRLNASLKSVYDRYINAIPGSHSEVFDRFSLERKALANQPVFPALNLVRGGFLTFDEVRINTELLEIYRQHYPQLYDLFVRTAKKKGYEVQTSTGQENYIATEFKDSGILRYKYLPFIIPATQDVREVLKQLVSEKQGVPDGEKQEAIEFLDSIPDSMLVWIKADFETINNGNVGFGYVSKLTVSEPTGKTVAVFEVDIEEFYDRLVGAGIVKPDVKHISQHPDYKRVLTKILTRFSDENSTPDVLFTQEEMEYITRRLKELKAQGYNIKDAVGKVSAEIYKTWNDQGRTITQRVFKLDVIEDTISSIETKLKSMQFDRDTVKQVSNILKDLYSLYRKNPVMFSQNLIEVSGSGWSRLENRSVKDYLTEKISAVVKDSGIAASVVQDMLSGYVNLSRIEMGGIDATAKMVYTYVHSKEIKRALSEGNFDRAYKLFEDLHVNKLGLRPHQFYVPLNTAILSELTPAKKAVFGWEMRTGKTLASAFHLYLNSLLDDRERPGMFEVRSANVFDITNQVVNYLPYVVPFLAVYPNEQDTYIKDKLTVITDRCIPNVFFNTKLFRGKGSTVETLLSQNPFLYIEETAARLTDQQMKEIEKQAKGKPFEPILYLEGFDRTYLYATVEYLLRHEDKLENNRSHWDAFIKNLSKYSNHIKQSQERKRKTRLMIVSKDTHHLRFNYRLRFRQKLLGNVAGVQTMANADVELKEHKDLSGIENIDRFYAVRMDTVHRLMDFVEKDLRDELMASLTPVGQVNGIPFAVIEKEKLFEFIKENSWLTPEKLDSYNNFYETSAMSLRKFITGLLSDKRTIKSMLSINDDHISADIVSPEPAVISKKEKNGSVYYTVKNTEGFLSTNIKIDTLSGKLVKSVNYEYDLSNENVRKVYETTTTNKSPIIYSYESVSMFSCIDKDEADQTPNIMSTSNKISTYMAQKVGKTGIVSGTLSSGDVSSLVSFLSIGSDIEDVARLTNMAQRYYDIYEVSEKHEGFFRIMMEVISAKKEDQEYFDSLVSVLLSGDHKAVIDFFLADTESITPHDINKLKNLKVLLEKSTVDRLNFIKILNDIASSITSSPSMFDPNMVTKAVFDVLKGSGLLKKGIGTTNLSFVKMIPDDVSASLLTAEQLTGIKRVIQRTQLEENAHKAVKQFMVSKHLMLESTDKLNVGTLKTMSPEDALLLSGVIQEGVNSSDLSSMLMIDWKTVAEMTVSYAVFMQVVKRLQSELLNHPEFADLVSKSGKTTQDSLYDYVRAVVLKLEDGVQQYGSFEDEKEETEEETEEAGLQVEDVVSRQEDLSQQKKQFASEVIDAILNSRYAVNSEDNEIEFTFNVRGKQITVKDSLSNYNPEELDYMLKRAVNLKYSINIDLFAGRNIDVRIFKNKTAVYPFRFQLVESKDDEVIETAINRGILHSVNQNIQEGKSFAILPSRVHLTNLAIADVLSTVLREKEQGKLKKQVQVIVRVTDRKVKEFVDNLDVEYLRKKGVVVKAYSSQSLVDAELMSLKDDSVKNSTQTVVISPAQSTSRGVDLSMLDSIVFYGTLLNPREFMQAVQRLHNPAKYEEIDGEKISKAELIMYGTGFVPSSKSSNSNAIPTATSIIVYKNELKKEFTDSVMSGSLSPVVQQGVVISYKAPEFEKYVKQGRELQIAV